MDDLIYRNVLIGELKKIKFPCMLPSGAEYLDGIQTAVKRISGVINDAPTVNRWIPVSERLPEIGYNVLVTRQTENNTRYVRIASRQDDCWMDNTDKYGKPNPHQVIAWMPMPNAYEPLNNMIGD